MRQAVVLCGGRGSRLGKRTESTPKSLLPVRGRPLLHQIIDKLIAAGFTDVVLVVGHFGGVIEQACAPWSQVRCVWQKQPCGTADALLAAQDILESAFLLTYGDLWISGADYAEIRQTYNKDGTTCIGVVKMSRPRGAAVYVVDDRVHRIVEKPTWNGQPNTPWNATGLFTLQRGILEDCREIAVSSRGELELADAIQRSIDRGANYGLYELREAAEDIGVAERYDALCATLLHRHNASV